LNGVVFGVKPNLYIVNIFHSRGGVLRIQVIGRVGYELCPMPATKTPTGGCGPSRTKRSRHDSSCIGILAGFDFAASPVDKALITKLADLSFTEDAHNVNWTPKCGHHELRKALSTDGRFGRLRRIGNRPSVDNAVVLIAIAPRSVFRPRRASAARIAPAARTPRTSACALCCSSQCTQ